MTSDLKPVGVIYRWKRAPSVVGYSSTISAASILIEFEVGRKIHYWPWGSSRGFPIDEKYIFCAYNSYLIVNIKRKK
jgi:hypothetical protein